MIGFRRGRVSKDTNCPDRKDPYGKGTDLPEDKYRYNFLYCYKRYRRVPVTTHSLSVANWMNVQVCQTLKLRCNQGFSTDVKKNGELTEKNLIAKSQFCREIWNEEEKGKHLV